MRLRPRLRSAARYHELHLTMQCLHENMYIYLLSLCVGKAFL